MRRSLGVALWGLVGLLACFLGAFSSLVGTGAGRRLLTRVAEGSLGKLFAGSVEIADVRGSLFTGLSLSEVRLLDPDSTLVAWIPRADVAYNPFDFAAGRVLLFELDLHQPVINIVQHRNGRLNLEELLRLGGPEPPGRPRGPAALILFRNVRVRNGSVTLRLQARRPQPGDTALEIAQTRDGRLRIRRFEHLDARLAALQISSPRERGIRIAVTELAVESRDPVARLTDVAGNLRILGDTLEVDLQRVHLPGSALRAARGQISWPSDTLLFDLALRADSATLRDFALIDRRFAGPIGSGALAGGVRLRSHGGRLLEVGLDPLRLDYGGGVVTGRLTALVRADSGLAALRDAELVSRDFDLEFARPFLDTLPFAGRLSGRTVATGPLRALALDVDWAFRDSLVTGWPESRIRGNGEVDLLAVDGIRFQPFSVEAAAVDLGTVRRLVPAVTLRGELYAAGTLAGPLKDAEFVGRLEHREGARPPSAVAGTVRLDSRTDTLGVYADVNTDSLSFDGLKGSFPGLRLHGAVAGPVRLSGTLAGLETHAKLRSRGGTVDADGVLQLGLPRYGVSHLTLRARDLDLARWIDGGPASRLALTVRGSIAGDSVTPPVGDLAVDLGPSLFAGTALDSGDARLRFADRRLYVDSLGVALPGVTATGRGSLGWSRPTRGALELDLRADSLGSLDSLVSWLSSAGGLADGRPGDAALAGDARVTVKLEGSLDSLGFEARANTARLKWREWEVRAGRARIAYRPGPASDLQIDAALDSLSLSALGFGGAVVAAAGSRDSLAWSARARAGTGGALLGGGRYTRRANASPGGGSVVTVALDSLAVQIPGDVWVLDLPTELTVTDSAVSVRRLALRSAYDTGEVLVRGDLPARGPVQARLELENVPLVGLYALLEHDTTGIGGTVTATAELAGTRAAPELQGAFSLTNGAFGAFRTPFVDGTFGYQGRRLDAALHVWRSGQQILNVQAHLPLDLSLVPVAQRQLPDTLSVRAVADSVDLSVLEAVTSALRQVVGVFSADVGIGGTWDAPRLRGAAAIAGAAATIPALNVRYEGINGQFALSGDTILLRSLAAKSDKGRADVTGVVRLERLSRPVLDLRIAADQFKALDLRNNVTITASGRLALRGPVFGATLTGRATVASGVLYFADLVQKRIVDLDQLADTSLASIIAEQRLGPEFQSVFLDSLRIQDLELGMGSDVWLRSNEANIQLAGTVRLTKQRNLYLVSGTLLAARGTYRLKIGPVTREFVVTQGTVRYFGTPDQDAALDIEAKHVVHPVPTPGQLERDITVVAHIGGTLLVPRVTLAAEKRDLSQTEVISYVLFGRSSVDVAGDQGGIANRNALLRSALAVLSGEIEQTIVSGGVPVDYLEIRPAIGAGGDPLPGLQFAVGRQLGAKTFLVLNAGVNAGVCEGRPIGVGKALGLSLQFRISPEWRTEASVEPVQTCAELGAQPQGTVPRQVGLDLFWEKRY